MKTVAYIAGDKYIVKSAIVVFKSLSKYEPSIDKYLFISNLDIDKLDMKNLKDIGVTVLKLENDAIFKDSLSWPKECFLNFKVPNSLEKLGYDIAIKLDYDILINGKLDISTNIPKKLIFASTIHNRQTLRDMVLNNFDFFEKEFNIKNWNKKAILFGALFIDLKKYVEFDFWEKYRNSFANILKNSPSKSSNIIFADMGLFMLVLEKYNLNYKIIKDKYNTCASVRHLKSRNTLNLKPRLIHYAGPKKPWKNTNIKILTNPYYSYFKQLWIDFVLENTDFNCYLNRQKLRKTSILLSIKKKLIKSYIYLLFIKLYTYLKVSKK